MVTTAQLILKVTVATVIGFFKHHTVISVVHKGTFIGKGAVIGLHGIERVAAVHHPIAVKKVLTTSNQRIEITVFGFTNMAVVVAVYRVEYGSSFSRHNAHQLVKLLKKRSIKVKLSSVVGGIPSISPPVGIVVDGEGDIGIVRAQYQLSARITLTRIKLPFVSTGHQFLPLFLGRKRRTNEFREGKRHRHAHNLHFLVASAPQYAVNWGYDRSLPPSHPVSSRD